MFGIYLLLLPSTYNYYYKSLRTALALHLFASPAITEAALSILPSCVNEAHGIHIFIIYHLAQPFTSV